jgi:hypothetical protein
MFAKLLPLFVIVTTVIGANQNIDLQLGLTHIFHERYYDGAKEIGYRAELGWAFSSENRGLDFNFRALGFPGSENAFAWYADVSAPFYFTDKPTCVFAAPLIGYSHASEQSRYGDNPRSKHDFIRAGCTLGLKAFAGRTYLTTTFSLIPEFSPGDIYEIETWDGYIYLFSRFYVEWSLDAEFGWRLSDHFGLTVKGGIINRNYLLTKKTRGNFVPYGELGPSFYL